MGDKITLFLYLNSAVYYLIMFVCPIIFKEDCGEGINPISHIIYGVYSIFTLILEVWIVFAIQAKL